MEERIRNKLREIEEKEQVKILYCVESGSRAWGFASPDSDYDVRFIYVRPKEFYLRLNKGRDVIEWQLDDTLDINGWDIQKAFLLLYKSNPTLFEWNASPIVYKTTREWDKISKLLKNYFSVKATLYHYFHMAKRNFYENFKGETVCLKKYFYVLRPLLACEWVLEKGTPPPILFKTLVDEYLDGDLKADVEALLDKKMNAPEFGEGARYSRLDKYIEKSMARVEEILQKMPECHNHVWDELNSIFLSLVENYEDLQ
nr:nucleotidyltransferase domain-containing protein [Clostridia bacterium]